MVFCMVLVAHGRPWARLSGHQWVYLSGRPWIHLSGHLWYSGQLWSPMVIHLIACVITRQVPCAIARVIAHRVKRHLSHSHNRWDPGWDSCLGVGCYTFVCAGCVCVAGVFTV